MIHDQRTVRIYGSSTVVRACNMGDVNGIISHDIGALAFMAHGPLPHPPTLPHPHVHLMRFLLASSLLPPRFLLASPLASSLLPRRFLFAQIRLQNDRQHLRLLRDLQTAPGLRREHQLPIGRPEHHVLHRGPRIPPQLRAGTHGRVWSRYPPWRIWSVVPPTVGDHIRRCGVLGAVCGVLYAVYRMLYAARGALSLTHKRHCLRRLPPLLLTVCDQCTKRRPGNRV